MIQSKAVVCGHITLPQFTGHQSMIPFDLETLAGLPQEFVKITADLTAHLKTKVGTAFFTIHGKTLKAGQTLRRPGPHTDGSYDKTVLDWNGGGGGGWKIGENGPSMTSAEHARLYLNTHGGIILASNYAACKGFVGEFKGIPGVGGDCSKLTLNEPFMLEANKIYYGNNHFVHESLPMQDDVHRVFVRITLPETHAYEH